MDNRAMEIQSEIAGLKQILAATDYKALKHADGALSDAELAVVTSKEEADAE